MSSFPLTNSIIFQDGHIAPPTSFYHHVTMKVAGVFGWKVGTLCLDVEDPHRSAPRWSKFWWFEGTTNCLMVWNHGFFLTFQNAGLIIIPWLVWNMNLISPFSWELHHPNWRSPYFFRGVSSNHNQTVASKKPLVEASGRSLWCFLASSSPEGFTLPFPRTPRFCISQGQIWTTNSLGIIWRLVSLGVRWIPKITR